MVNKTSYCVSCKSKTAWAGTPRYKEMKNRVVMLKGKCAVCHKGKATITKQFVKKKKTKPKTKTTYKSKRTGKTKIKITKKKKRTVRKKKGGFLGTALSVIPDIAGGLTYAIKKKRAPYVTWTSDPLYYKRHSKTDGSCLHPADQVCDLHKAKLAYDRRH